MFNDNQIIGWNQDDVVDYFKNNRRSYNQLYDSEKYFINDNLIQQTSSILDVGCASGGFNTIFRKLNNNISYYGVDVSEKNIEYAKYYFKHSNNSNFYLYSGKSLFEIETIKNIKFDLSFCSGLLHLIDNWSNLFTEIIYLSKKYVLIDFRVSLKKNSYSGTFYFDYGGNVKKNYTKYYVININDLFKKFF